MSTEEGQQTPGGHEVVPPAPYVPPTYKQYVPPTYEPQYQQYQAPADVESAEQAPPAPAPEPPAPAPEPPAPAPEPPLPPYARLADAVPQGHPVAPTTPGGYPIAPGPGPGFPTAPPAAARAGSPKGAVIVVLAVVALFVVFGIVMSATNSQFSGALPDDGYSDSDEFTGSDDSFDEDSFYDDDSVDDDSVDFEEEEWPGVGESSPEFEEQLQAKIDEYQMARRDGTLWDQIDDNEFNRTAVVAYLYLLTDMKSATMWGIDDATGQEYIDRADELEELLLSEQPLGSDIEIRFTERTFTYDGETGEGGYTDN